MSYLQALPATPPPSPLNRIQAAIHNASTATGVNFNYLLHKAAAESSLDPTAKATRSSAQGLFQFTQKTWLQMVRDHGPKYGLNDLAACIDGDCQVTDPNARQKILNLRRDPHMAALMAAEYAQDNAEHLRARLGPSTSVGETELYLAHFLGPNGATRFLSARADNGDQTAATLFPREAKANPGVFYENGQARSLNDIYTHFAQKMNANTPPTTVALAAHPIPTTSPAPASTMDPPQEDPGYSAWEPETPLHIARETVDRLLAHQRQLALLVLAQTYAHNDAGRYNS